MGGRLRGKFWKSNHKGGVERICRQKRRMATSGHVFSTNTSPLRSNPNIHFFHTIIKAPHLLPQPPNPKKVAHLCHKRCSRSTNTSFFVTAVFLSLSFASSNYAVGFLELDIVMPQKGGAVSAVLAGTQFR